MCAFLKKLESFCHPSMHVKAKTRIIIKYDAGFGNALFIRGSGSGLNWDKGLPLKNVRENAWVIEFRENFNTIEFKILINDKVYETGSNHILKCGATIQFTPKF